jgi:hypothetical protein
MGTGVGEKMFYYLDSIKLAFDPLTTSLRDGPLLNASSYIINTGIIWKEPGR